VKRPITTRLVAMVLGFELPFLVPATAAFAWILALGETEQLTAAIVLVALTFLGKSLILVALLARLLAPAERALAAGATAEVLAEGVNAARRATVLGPVLVGLSWGALYLVPGLLLRASLPEGLPYGDQSLVSLLLYVAAIVLGVPPTAHGIFVLTLSPSIATLSLAARGNGVEEPTAARAPLRMRFVVISLCLTLGPAMWVASLAHALVLMDLDPPWGLPIAVFLFGLIVVLWALVAAVAVSGAIGGAVAHITQVVQEIAASGGTSPSRVPVLQRDELGLLAGALNQTADRLAVLESGKRQFISMAAHELKTPITVVKGYTQLLRSGVEAARQDSALEAIERGTDRIDRIVCYCLDYAQLQLGGIALRPQRFELGPLAEEVAAEEASRRGRVIFVTGSEPATRVMADPERIRGVLRALIDNAAKYSPPQEPVELSIRTAEDGVTLRVVDRGVGIAAERQPRIFEPFYRAHADTPDDVGGIGVGLYNAREVIRRSGGELGFLSAEGKGSTFWFRLPSGADPEGMAREESVAVGTDDRPGGRG
jgi:signal transduction histidine kinase